ncbi:CDP-glucose 4,6-dehydratase [Sphingomonas sp. CARO-RG-8B-R24-01]|uniref:CDP-glucose 4,6-dehydratase n=1 Tax=Sphingomonas sp. CARO-RG-8B-R24-01 TaxID=2914831 RepID=UPI001F5769BC
MGKERRTVAHMGLNRSFWTGRRVLVTGHTGFKGSWLTLMLQALGAKVHGLALDPPTAPSMFDLLGLASVCDHRVGDIRDLATVEAAFAAVDPEIVIHMAAQPLVRLSYDDPVGTYATNVMGTVHVLDACRRAPNLRAAVMITTDKCYQNNGWVWGYRETDRLGGADPYSNSKAACELVVDAYRQSYFGAAAPHRVALASARAGNVIGGGDFALDRLVPDAMRAFAAGQSLMIRNPLSVRPWQHVLEPLAGYLRLAEVLWDNPDAATGWNFGPRPDESASVERVVDALVGLWGEGAAWVQDEAEHPHEAATLKLDSTKAAIELGWQQRLPLEEALRLTSAWYACYHQHGALERLTRDQVETYLGLD